MKRLIVCVVMWSLAAVGEAQERVALQPLVEQALAVNPGIAAAERRYLAAAARPAQERSLPDPMVSAGYNSSGSPLPGAGLGSEPTANIGFMVSQEIPFPGKRGLRAAVAARDAYVERQEIEVVRLGIAARVKDAYYQLAYADAAGEVLARNEALLEALLKVTEHRYAVGKAVQQDVIKAQTALSILALRQERIRQDRTTAQSALNALLNRPSATPIGRPEDLTLVEFTHAVETLVDAAVEHAPLLQKDRLSIDRWQARVEAARKDYRPDFAVSGGYAYMGSMPPMYEFRVDVNVPLRRDRRAAAVVEQTNSLAAARSSYDSTRLAIESELARAHQMASTSLTLARLYRDTVLPQARLALESSMASYQTGTVDFLSVLTNFGAVLEYEMTYFEELAGFHAAASRIEEMTGRPLVH